MFFWPQTPLSPKGILGGVLINWGTVGKIENTVIDPPSIGEGRVGKYRQSCQKVRTFFNDSIISKNDSQ